MVNLFVPLLIANFIAVVVGSALLLLAVIAAFLRWRGTRESARLALWGAVILLLSGIFFLVMFQNGLYCMAGCG